MNTTEAKVEIIEVINRCSHALDGEDLAFFLNLFTEDGQLIEKKLGQETTLGKGQTDLKTWFEKEISERGSSQPRRHVRNTIFIELKPDSALSRTYFLATSVDGPGKLARITDTGIFEDAIVLLGENWKIKKRLVIYDYPGN